MNASPLIQLPRPLQHVLSRLPQLPPTLLLSLLFNLNKRFIDPAQLQPLQHRILVLEIQDLGIVCRFSWNGNHFYPLISHQQPDLAIRANLYDFFQMLTKQEDPDTLFFNRRLIIEGDTELGLLLKNTLEAARR